LGKQQADVVKTWLCYSQDDRWLITTHITRGQRQSSRDVLEAAHHAKNN
jgi:hypothetical protein